MNVVVCPACRARSDRRSQLHRRIANNIRRSRALVAAADAIVRSGHRMRRPKLAGGTDSADAPGAKFTSQRVVRTWTKVQHGALPAEEAMKRRWVGRGRGERCNGCGEIIGGREIEFEIEFRNALLLRLHAECFKAWESFDGRLR